MNLKEHYQTVVVPKMKETFGYKNAMAVPRLVKVILNVGISSGLKDQKVLPTIKETLRMITGQEPVERLARKSISSFKIRQGQTVGLTVTLRGRRMYDFLTRLIHLGFPRVRDFRGISPSAVDGHGNLTVGFREAVAFPEIKAGDIERQHGLEVTIVTTAGNRVAGLGFLKLMGIPFREK